MYASKLSQIVLIFIVILGCLSAWSGKGIFAAKVDSSKTGTGLQAVTSSTTVSKATVNSKSGKQKTEERIVISHKEITACDTKCKTDQLITLGIRPEIASSLVTNCKALADNPVHCIKFWSSVIKNESGWGYHCWSKTGNKFNCSGMWGTANYKSYNDWVLHWIWKYNKYWYKAKSMSFFYSKAWSLPPSHYCTDEISSWTKVGCPNGLRNSTQFFNKITF